MVVQRPPKLLETLLVTDLSYLVQIFGVSPAQFDELADEHIRAELYDGVMVVHSPASWEHEDVSEFVRSLLRLFVDARGLGKVIGPDGLICINPERKFSPDVVYVRRDRLQEPLPREFVGTPDLVVEVLSPSTRDFDLHEKRPAYQAAGIPEIWLIDRSQRQLLCYTQQAGTYAEAVFSTGRLTSTAVPGFWIETDWFWSSPLPSTLACLLQILGPQA